MLAREGVKPSQCLADGGLQCARLCICVCLRVRARVVVGLGRASFQQ